MKKRRFKKTKRFLKVILILILGGIVYSFAFSTYENIKVNQQLNDFKSRAIESEMYEKEMDYTHLSTNKQHIRRYWPVPRETSHEEDGKNVFKDSTRNTIGKKGDIFVTRQSPFPSIPVLHQFMTYYYGGHAAIYDGTYFLEATGYPDDLNEFVKIVTNKGDDPDHGLSTTANRKSFQYWTTPAADNPYQDIYYRETFVGLRIKDIDDELIDGMVDSANEKIDNNRLYNFLFFLNMKYKYYCTDLVSRSYEESYRRVKDNNPEYRSKGYAKNLNDDGFITSVNDLILSKETYIHLYFELEVYEDKVIENFYYLKDIEG